MNKSLFLAALAVLSLVAAGCSPEVGSEGWCKQMKAKPKGDWTANEVMEYSRHCILK
jgi:Protein of unknown function (DUF3012)